MQDDGRNRPQRVHPLEEPAVQSAPGGVPQQALQRIAWRFVVRRPLVTYTLIAINVLIFIVRATSFETDIALLEWGANYGPLVFGQGEFWRLLTSMFLHSSIYNVVGRFALEGSAHLLFNMLTLYYVGSTVERVYGHERFLLIYLLGGLTGSFVSALFNNSYSVGASGAVFAMLGAEFIFYYKHRGVLGDFARFQLRNLGMLALFNLFGGLLSARIDNWAHIGGAVSGMLLASVAGAQYSVREREDMRIRVAQPDEASVLRPHLMVLAAYAVVLVIAFIFVTLTMGNQFAARL